MKIVCVYNGVPFNIFFLIVEIHRSSAYDKRKPEKDHPKIGSRMNQTICIFCKRLGYKIVLGCTPYRSVLDFWKIKFEKSSSTNWIFNLQKLISKLIFAGYTGSRNPVRNRLKIQFVNFDFPKLIFQKSSTDQQGIGLSNMSMY